jgi:hypothetical protein
MTCHRPAIFRARRVSSSDETPLDFIGAAAEAAIA